jgi:hypothetical protein
VKTADSAIAAGNLALALEAAQAANKINEEDPKSKSIIFRLTDPQERKRLEANADRLLSQKLVDTAQVQYQEKNYTAALASLEKAEKLWPQNNRIAFLKNQAVEGLTGVPTNQKNQAEVKFTFEPNQGFRRTGNTGTPNSTTKSDSDVSIGVKQNGADKKQVQTNTIATDTALKIEALAEPQPPIKTEDKVTEPERTIKEKVDEVQGKLMVQNEQVTTNPLPPLEAQLEVQPEKNVTPLPIVQLQKAEFPYDEATLSAKFPNLDFSKPPHGQKFTMDFYSENEKEMNASKSVEILDAPVNLPVRDSSNGILVKLDNLSFGVYNSYYRISVSNFSNNDFAIGYMMLSVERKNGESTNFEPSYISAFPVVMPAHQAQFVYATRQIQLNNDDKIILNLFERKTNARFTIELPGELYNNEYDK